MTAAVATPVPAGGPLHHDDVAAVLRLTQCVKEDMTAALRSALSTVAAACHQCTVKLEEMEEGMASRKASRSGGDWKKPGMGEQAPSTAAAPAVAASSQELLRRGLQPLAAQLWCPVGAPPPRSSLALVAKGEAGPCTAGSAVEPRPVAEVESEAVEDAPPGQAAAGHQQPSTAAVACLDDSKAQAICDVSDGVAQTEEEPLALVQVPAEADVARQKQLSLHAEEAVTEVDSDPEEDELPPLVVSGFLRRAAAGGPPPRAICDGAAVGGAGAGAGAGEGRRAPPCARPAAAAEAKAPRPRRARQQHERSQQQQQSEEAVNEACCRVPQAQRRSRRARKGQRGERPAAAGQLWRVVGGEEANGILVRTGWGRDSPFAAERLSTGALVVERVRRGGRLLYERVSGTGPDKGWVSVELQSGRPLLVQVAQEDSADRKELDDGEGGEEEPRPNGRQVTRLGELEATQLIFVLEPFVQHPEALLEPLMEKGIFDLYTLHRKIIQHIKGIQELPMLVALSEEDLLALDDRIHDWDQLKDLVAGHWHDKQEQRGVCLELLRTRVTSIRELLEQELDLTCTPGAGRGCLGGVRLEEMLQSAHKGEAEKLQDPSSRSLAAVPFGSFPFLATAPHNLFLLRDGQPPHAMEERTSKIAQDMARELDGSVLRWTAEAQWRSELRYALGAASHTEACPESYLDPANRDPNYLFVDELGHCAWFNQMQSWASEHHGRGCKYMLHVDIHGCQDPPKYPTHVILGVAAMRQHLENTQATPSELRCFAHAVQEAVAEVLAPVLGVPPEETVSLRGLDPIADCHECLSGAWPPDSGRLTQTQQSVLCGVSHAVQMEMSLTLRRLLGKSPKAVASLARALREAWQGQCEALLHEFYKSHPPNGSAGLGRSHRESNTVSDYGTGSE